MEDWRTKAIGLFPGLPEGAEVLTGPISGSPALWGEVYLPLVNPYDEKPVNKERIGRFTIFKQPQTDGMEAHVSDAVAIGFIDGCLSRLFKNARVYFDRALQTRTPKVLGHFPHQEKAFQRTVAPLNYRQVAQKRSSTVRLLFGHLGAAGMCFLMVFCAAEHQVSAQETASAIGGFESHSDVGKVLHAGSVEYDAAKRSYTIAGGGENMWFGADAFQFVWTKASGDATLTADISFLGTGGNAHRKAVLMIRQSLDADSVYADIALHGNGLTALQFRDAQGALTQEVQSQVQAPKRLRIEKHGAYFTMWLSGENGEMQMAGASPKIELKEPFYIGIGVCSHDKDVVERAVFTNVNMTTAPPNVAAAAAPATLFSILETVPVDSTDRMAVYVSSGRFEAPNWTRDGKAFLFNRDGRILRLPVSGGKPETIDTGFAIRCNNDHGISPDSTQLVISDQSQEDHKSLIYLVPINGGTPKRITKHSPSYWHGWSPDGKTLAFVGQRNDEFDIYTIAVTGGEEIRLTTTRGLDDGPEYSPDGQYIYFNSERTGHMQIWRMKADGSGQEQVFSDGANNWFPHISPDGKYMVFLTFEESVSGHPENKDVMLRLMSLSDKKIRVLAKLFGGQGTINVPSWSPDSKQLAFVSYAIVPNAPK